MILLVSSIKNWRVSEVREHRWIQSLFVESALWPRWSRPLHLKPFTLWIVLTPESVMILLVSSKLTDLGSQGTSLDSIVVYRERPLASVKPTLTKRLHSLNSFATYSRMGNLSFWLCFKRNKDQTQNSIGSNVAISASCFWAKKTKEQVSNIVQTTKITWIFNKKDSCLQQLDSIESLRNKWIEFVETWMM